jgi:hypothetical protein
LGNYANFGERGKFREIKSCGKIETMFTEILGGGSFKNKAWVDELQQQLSPDIATKIVYWNDWVNGQDAKIDFKAEEEKVLAQVGDEPFNMIAKSVGSYIGLGVVAQKLGQIKKLIICGIPLKDFPFGDLEKRYQVLASLNPENVIVFQNEFDNHGTHEKVKDFLTKIAPAIQVIKKTGEHSQTHHYPYPQDFKDFLLKEV